MDKSFDRWIHSLRDKASRFEYTLPITNRIYPTLDDICNEMKAFRDGFNAAKNKES